MFEQTPLFPNLNHYDSTTSIINHQDNLITSHHLNENSDPQIFSSSFASSTTSNRSLIISNNNPENQSIQNEQSTLPSLLPTSESMTNQDTMISQSEISDLDDLPLGYILNMPLENNEYLDIPPPPPYQSLENTSRTSRQNRNPRSFFSRSLINSSRFLRSNDPYNHQSNYRDMNFSSDAHLPLISEPPPEYSALPRHTLNVTTQSTTLFCPKCQNHVETVLKKRPTTHAYACSLILCFIFWPIFWVPCVSNSMRESVLKCTECKLVLAVVDPEEDD
ncbi:hypothetical protein G9A89_023284 [Geosiphon pyriformis]|nr:hypothetical protein G9A89_023284 [Geosiphon pyriformis]